MAFEVVSNFVDKKRIIYKRSEKDKDNVKREGEKNGTIVTCIGSNELT